MPWPLESEGGGLFMRRYEVMIILDPDLEEKTIAPSLEAFLNVIRADGGTVHNVDLWGKRRLAYEINHKSEGYYVVIDMDATPAAIAELDRQLNLNEAIVRTKVTKPQLVPTGSK
jgi:small subunit ribosomal protein S6